MHISFDEKFKKLMIPALFIMAIITTFLFGILFQRVNELKGSANTTKISQDAVVDKEKVIPSKGFTLPISWGDLGPKLIALGVIDQVKFINTANLNSEDAKILTQGSDAPITINSDNSQFVVDFLWAIGLAEKSNAYSTGPMGTDYKKDISNFSSTGGWTLGKNSATSYLGKSNFFNLDDAQEKRVEEIAKNIYRPCCNNSTWFPDCNHGMAALAAIEMMVAKNLPDDEIYKNVLKLNSFWFSGTYLTTAQYFANRGVSWDKVDAKQVLSAEFSSQSGASQIVKKVEPIPGNGGGPGCGA